MKNDELEFYSKIKNWDFSMIKYKEENLTAWDMYDILKRSSTKDSKILDLGTAGGEKVLNEFPEVREIVGTDFSKEMIETANRNLKEMRENKEWKNINTNISFRVMDNLKMDTQDEYFDIVVARHTCIVAEDIYKTLKNNGKLILRGVDKLDCWQLKMLFGTGQAFNDIKPISQIDYENIMKAGFKNVELVPIYIREYYKTKEDLIALLLKTPILEEFSEENENNNLGEIKLDMDKIDKYIEENSCEKGILLRRRYYGITAEKR